MTENHIEGPRGHEPDLAERIDELVDTPRTGSDPDFVDCRRPWDAVQVTLANRLSGRLPRIANTQHRTCHNQSTYTAATNLITSHFTSIDGAPLLLTHQGEWMVWDCGAWYRVKETDMLGWLTHRYAHAYSVRILSKKEQEETGKKWKYEAWPEGSGIVKEMSAQVSKAATVDSDTRTGAWIDGRNDDETYISCKNGLLRVSDRKLLPHNPAFFSIYSLPFDYDPSATCPRWTAWMEDTYEHDPDTVPMKQEWWGYVISGRTDLQKGSLTFGRERTGKGTEQRVQNRFLGGDVNISGLTLSSLGERFGLWDAIDKSLIVIGDARIDKKADKAAVERLLSIIGEDKLTLDRKNRSPWTGKIPARIAIMSNEIPDWGDRTGVLPTRWLVSSTVKSYLGKEDRGLEDRLCSELPGILNWALDGLDRLNQQGRFTENVATREVVHSQRSRANPYREFVDEFCVEGGDKWVAKDRLRELFISFSANQGRTVNETVHSFSMKLLEVVPTILAKDQKKRVGGKRVPVFLGIGIKSDYAQPEDVAAPLYDESGQLLTDI
ncbi:phage/plasmid primase, P4 family [Streptomyces sp. VNUA74]|uniref:DNA primase family protein n=1 Tax=Streptomyces sp. VNUA74 TaxID=3062685 RepID=UPI00280B5B33|nr:phage/plasmid primase, P4 family [Streptomyces sp. VNUA74]WML79161.1 phage/plasmid primase, P4 family [Streptomyces sp. VNUA74]